MLVYTPDECDYLVYKIGMDFANNAHNGEAPGIWDDSTKAYQNAIDRPICLHLLALELTKLSQ